MAEVNYVNLLKEKARRIKEGIQESRTAINKMIEDMFGSVEIIWKDPDSAFPSTVIESNREIDFKRAFEIWLEVGGFSYHGDGKVYVYPRQQVLELREEGEGVAFHNETGPAIISATGEKYYYLSHNRIPEQFAWAFVPNDQLRPTQEQVKDLLSYENVTIRALLIARIGMERLLDYVPHMVLDEGFADSQTGRHEYQLLEITLSDIGRAVFLSMINPSTGDRVIEAVPPETESVEDAIFFRANGRLPEDTEINEHAVAGFPIALT